MKIPQSPGDLGVFWFLPDGPLHPVPVSHCLVSAVLAPEALGLKAQVLSQERPGSRETPGRWWQESGEKKEQQTLDLEEEKGYSCQSVSEDSGSHTGWKPGPLSTGNLGTHLLPKCSCICYLVFSALPSSPPSEAGDRLGCSTSLQGPVWESAQKSLYLGGLHHLGRGISEDLGSA